MILYEKPFCSIEFLEEKGLVIQRWNGFAASEQFRDALTFTAKFFEEHSSATLLLSDTLKQKPVHPDDSAWAATAVNPRLVQAGMKKMGFVMPESVITKLGVKNFSQSNEAPFEMNFLSDYEATLEWILT